MFIEVGLTSIVNELNDRQTLIQTLQVFSTESVNVFSIIQSIDKLDKQSVGEVVAELVGKGLKQDAAQSVITAIETAQPSPNLQAVIDATVQLGVPRENLLFNPRIARGLDYYTGIIFEGRIPEYTVGSVGGGGRYDNLINDLAGYQMPAVGFGIGFDRTVEAADQLGLIPTEGQGTRVLVAVMSDNDIASSLAVAQQLRSAGVATEVYPATDKLAKQFKLADQKKIPFVVLVGEQERAAQKVTLKTLSSGEQQLLSLDECLKKVVK